MSACLYAPFVGQADCFLIKLPVCGNNHHILIDGGSRLAPQGSLPDYLKQCGVAELDGLILTHLHQDHLGQLEQVAEQYTVRKAVLPYPPQVFPSCLPKVFSKERADDIFSYRRLYAVLQRQGTACYYHFGDTPSQNFSFGSFSLTCLFPECAENSLVLQALQRLHHDVSNDPAEDYRIFSDQLNADSSIWLLQQAKTDVALFCGDALASSMQKILTKQNISPKLLKLSHHGRNDKGKIYFDEHLLAQLAPKEILISAETKRFEKHILPQAPYLSQYIILLPENIDSAIKL